jgi:rRNA-processing protein FCF1
MLCTLSELPKNPLVDTNVLFEFLVWRFCLDAEIPIPGNASRYLSTDDLKGALHWYFDKAKPIQTSPHVIAEIHGLVQSRAGWRGPRLSAFWRFAQEELARLRLEEDLVKVVKMDGPSLQSFGSADTSILELAARTRGVVVTEEGDLSGRLMRQEIKVLSCYGILALWQEWNR